MNLPLALVFGATLERAPYHPLDPVAPELVSLLEGRYIVEITTDPAVLRQIARTSPKLLILYDDNWNEAFDQPSLQAVGDWLRQGGRILMIHNGICWARRAEWFAFAGGRFSGHAEARILHYESADGGSFDHFEEPYRFQAKWFGRRTILGTYQEGGKSYPAWWWKSCNKGRLAYAQPGHSVESFRHPECRKWMLRLVEVLET